MGALAATRRAHTTFITMQHMQGREDLPQGEGHGALTAKHELPDPDIDRAMRLRPPEVHIDGHVGHSDLADTSDPEAMRRGPGAYEVILGNMANLLLFSIN